MAAPTYYTADMVWAMPDDGNRYETLHGELVVTLRGNTPLGYLSLTSDDGGRRWVFLSRQQLVRKRRPTIN